MTSAALLTIRARARASAATVLLLVGAAAPASAEDLRLHWAFADHMVLQRDRPTPVWGTAAPGAEVRVSFDGDTVVATASATGEWRIDLPARPASTTGPTASGSELVVTSERSELRLRDVVVGEVWLCAGQSNMDFPLERSTGGDEVVARASESTLVRLCDRTGSPSGVARPLSAAELANVARDTYFTGTWHRSSPESAAGFSAVGYSFAESLSRSLGVPVGVIDVSVGGSSTEGWVPADRLAASDDFAPLVDDFLATHRSHPFIRERTSLQLRDWIDGGRVAPRPRHFFEPGFLYDSAIDDLAPFGIRGVLWYQGESNAHAPQLADRLFRAMVEEWRGRWDRPDLPFHFVQLPGMGRSTWPEFREVQASWLELDHTGMAVTIDVGHPTNVHPTDKRPVGERLARSALARTYGLDVRPGGPVLESVERRGEGLALSFDAAGALAWAPGRDATGFEVCGADRRFHPAHATIDGMRVVLTSPAVPAPVDARYAWAPVPDWSLVDATGVPAAPFRTHSWRPVRVACIGDSITAGAGLDDPDTEAYPARLQQRLGDGYRVENFGRPGAGVVRTSMRTGRPRAYGHNDEHMRALAFAPHVVVSNLGINDIMAWAESGDAFVDDYVALVDEYRALDTEPDVWLWGPLTPLFDGQAFFGSPHEREIHAAIGRVASRTGAGTLDMYEPFRNEAASFPDHIHPDAKAADAIAERVAAALGAPSNVVVILADDLGFGDVGCFNDASKIPTPHIDRLAAEGMRFTDAHSPSSVCTPTRYGILTGRYAWRTALKKSVLWPWDPPLIDEARLTLPEVMRDAGYRTACIGKWHLGWDWPLDDDGFVRGEIEGHTWKPALRHGIGARVNWDRAIAGGPLAHGFDHYFGDDVPNFPPYAFIEDDRVTVRPTVPKPKGMFGHAGPAAPAWDLSLVMPTLAQRATAWIDEHAHDHDGEPFFLYLPLTAPHTPIAPSPRFAGMSEAGAYGDFVCEVDWFVGEVLAALERVGATGNTLVVFTSDNGSPQRDGTGMSGAVGSVRERYGHDPSRPWRGLKSDAWEGGHRVPFVVRWPGRVRAGSVNATPVVHTDLYRTLAGIVERELPPDAGEDSFDLTRTLTDGDASARDHLVHHSGNGTFAIRVGRWKLIQGRASGGFSRWQPPADAPAGQLYDLEADPGEATNLYAERPEVVARLRERLDGIRASGRSAPASSR